jgi:tetratricopeptide (TPR) repeat protein
MEAVLAALRATASAEACDRISEMLESAEAAQETKQAERAADYCAQVVWYPGCMCACVPERRLNPSKALEQVEQFMPATTKAMLLAHLDGSTEKLEELVEAGQQAEEALNVLVMLSQLLLLRGELSTDKAAFTDAAQHFAEAHSIALKISDEAMAARCKRSEGMLLLMKKDIKGAEAALDEAIQLCRKAGDGKEEAETVNLITQLHEGRDAKFDHCCELFHHALEALQAEGDMDAVNSTLLKLGQFRLRKHLGDTEKGGEIEFAELEMTDLDIQGAVSHYQTQVAAGGGEELQLAQGKLAEALTASGTIKMLLGDQPGAEEALDAAHKLYGDIGDEDGGDRAAALLSDITRIMDKVQSASVTPITDGIS